MQCFRCMLPCRRWYHSSSFVLVSYNKQVCVDAIFFGKRFAKWLQRPAREHISVGNSPLILDESSDHGLGQRYEDIWMQSSGTGRYCSENSPTFQTRALNPRFMMHLFGQKTGFRARNAGMNELKSGIPCSVSDHVTSSQRLFPQGDEFSEQ